MDGFYFTGFIVSSWPMGGFYSLLAGVALLLAVGVGAKAWFHDRAKGRARCGKCWYPLPEDGLRPCPECGWKPPKQEDLYRTRRSRRLAIVALLLVAVSGSAWYWPHVQYRYNTLGEPLIRAVVPTTYRVWALPYSDEDEWVILYHRVSGEHVPYGLFGSSSPDAPPPVVSSAILDLSPDPIHIGYSAIDPEIDYQSNSIFYTGPYLPDQRVWRWQGRYLLDRLWKVANDQERELSERAGAFYLYTGYCGYTRLDHVERVLPLLLGGHGDVFLQASRSASHWGPHGLDPRAAADQLTRMLLEGSDDLLGAMNVFGGLAIAGNPALDAIAACWATSDRVAIERGARLLQELSWEVAAALKEGDTAFRDQLDAEKVVAVLRWAETDGKESLGNNAYNAIVELVDLYPAANYDDDGLELERRFHEPDAFFVSFTKHFLDWAVDGYISKDLVHNEDQPPVLESFRWSGMNYVPPEHELWWEVLDQTDRLLDSDDESLRWLAITFYDPLYDTGEDTVPDRRTGEDIQRLRQRLEGILQRTDDELVQGQVEYILELLDEHKTQKGRP